MSLSIDLTKIYEKGEDVDLNQIYSQVSLCNSLVFLKEYTKIEDWSKYVEQTPLDKIYDRIKARETTSNMIGLI